MVKVEITVPDEIARFLGSFGFDVAEYAQRSVLENLAGDLNAGLETFVDLDERISKYGLDKLPELVGLLDKSMFKSLEGGTHGI